MPNTPSAAGLAAWRAFLEAHARVTAALEHELIAAHGLPLAWYDVLVQLSEAPHRRLRMTELASAVLLSKSGLTRLVDRMCEAHLVARDPDPGDRRGILVSLTAAGLERLREAAPAHLRGIQRHFAASLDEAQALAIAQALDRAGR